jgi:type VI secretion system protein ImpB
MGTENSQKWFERNRPPRVQISYDVETAGAIEKKELPMVVGVVADLSGMRDPDITPSTLGERRFIEIDRDTFDKVLTQIGPRIDVTGLGLGTTTPAMSGILKFESIDDFEPENVVKKVEGLKDLFKARNQLRDLMAKLDGNAPLEARLQALFLNDSGEQLADEERNKKLDELYTQSLATPTPVTPVVVNTDTPVVTPDIVIDPPPAPPAPPNV